MCVSAETERMMSTVGNDRSNLLVFCCDSNHNIVNFMRMDQIVLDNLFFPGPIC